MKFDKAIAETIWLGTGRIIVGGILCGAGIAEYDGDIAFPCQARFRELLMQICIKSHIWNDF